MKSRGALRLRSMISALVCVVFTYGLLSGAVYGMELGPTGLKLSGELQQTVNWCLSDEEFILGITSYELSLDQDMRRAGAGVDGHAYVSVKGQYDHATSEGKWLELDEAYVDIYQDLFDLRLGQQVVSWGTAYGFNPTSYVNPLPSMATLTQGGLADLAGLPVPAVYVSAYPSWKDVNADVGIVLVLNPRLQGVPLSEEMQAMVLYGIIEGIGQVVPLPVVPESLEFTAEPPDSLADRLEVAGRAGMNFGMWDLYISGFRGWEDTPVLWVESWPVLPASQPEPPYLTVRPCASYRKATAIGAALSGTSGPYTFWGEGNYTFPDKVEALDSEENIPLSTNDPYFQAIVGADRMFGNAIEFYIMGQYMYNSGGSLLMPYLMPGEKRESGHYLVAVGRATIHEDHQIEVMNICNLRDMSGLIVPRYTYKVNPMLSTWIGTTFLMGDSSTEFGGLPMKQSVFAGAKVVW